MPQALLAPDDRAGGRQLNRQPVPRLCGRLPIGGFSGKLKRGASRLLFLLIHSPQCAIRRASPDRACPPQSGRAARRSPRWRCPAPCPRQGAGCRTSPPGLAGADGAGRCVHERFLLWRPLTRQPDFSFYNEKGRPGAALGLISFSARPRGRCPCTAGRPGRSRRSCRTPAGRR